MLKNGLFFLFSEANDLGPCGANDRGGETPGHPMGTVLNQVSAVENRIFCEE